MVLGPLCPQKTAVILHFVLQIDGFRSFTSTKGGRYITFCVTDRWFRVLYVHKRRPLYYILCYRSMRWFRVLYVHKRQPLYYILCYILMVSGPLHPQKAAVILHFVLQIDGFGSFMSTKDGRYITFCVTD